MENFLLACRPRDSPETAFGRRRTYSGLLWDWIVRNRSPHLNWH